MKLVIQAHYQIIAEFVLKWLDSSHIHRTVDATWKLLGPFFSSRTRFTVSACRVRPRTIEPRIRPTEAELVGSCSPGDRAIAHHSTTLRYSDISVLWSSFFTLNTLLCGLPQMCRLVFLLKGFSLFPVIRRVLWVSQHLVSHYRLLLFRIGCSNMTNGTSICIKRSMTAISSFSIPSDHTICVPMKPTAFFGRYEKAAVWFALYIHTFW